MVVKMAKIDDNLFSMFPRNRPLYVKDFAGGLIIPRKLLMVKAEVQLLNTLCEDAHKIATYSRGTNSTDLPNNFKLLSPPR
jgi:hypothetical protein